MYLNHFKLTREPFTLSPNLDLYCDLPSHRDAMALLKYGLSQGECLMKITGDVGVGKTLLCRKVLDSLGDEYISCYVFNPFLSAEELLRAIAADLRISEIADKGRFDLVTLINDRLVEFHKNGKKVVVIIDESHLLTDEALEVLRLLTNLETYSDKLLHIILVGQPELNVRLNRPALRQINQRISYSYCMNGINREQTKKYVARRLLASGHDCGDIFKNSAIAMLHSASSGIPRVINILCNKALLLTYGKGAADVGKREIKMAIKDSMDLIKTVQKGHDTSFGLLTKVLPIVAAASALAVMGYLFMRLH